MNSNANKLRNSPVRLRSVLQMGVIIYRYADEWVRGNVTVDHPPTTNLISRGRDKEKDDTTIARAEVL